MHITTIKAPAVEPISIEEMKDYLQIEHNAEDGLLHQLIRSARSYVETFTSRALIFQTRRLEIWGHQAPRRFYLIPCAPFRELEGEVTVNGKNFGDYKIVKGAGRAILHLERRLDDTQTLALNFTCGYSGDARDVPYLLRQGVLMKAAALYRERSGHAPTALAELSDLLSGFTPLRLA